MKIDASECIPIEYIKDQIEEYRKFDHLGMYAEFLDMFIQDYKDNAMANYADRKTENSSEKPNNCEHITEDGVTCAKYPACDDCPDNPLNKVKGSERSLKGKTEPQTCETCKFELYCPEMCEGCCEWDSHYEPKDEPQTETQTETQNSNLGFEKPQTERSE